MQKVVNSIPTLPVSSLARFEAVFTYLLMFTHSYAELVPGLHIETFRVVVLVFVARPLVDDFWPHVSRSARSYARDAIRWPFISFWAVILILSHDPPLTVFGFLLAIAHVPLPNACPVCISKLSGCRPRFCSTTHLDGFWPSRDP